MSANGDIVSDGFGKALEKFRQRLSDGEKLAFASGSIDEVKGELQRIQDRLGPEKKLRGFARIRKFLEGMKQVEALVSIFLNVHEVVAFIWVRVSEYDVIIVETTSLTAENAGPGQTCPYGKIYYNLFAMNL